MLTERGSHYAASEGLVASAHGHYPTTRLCENTLPMPHRAEQPVKLPLKVSWSGPRRFGDFHGIHDPRYMLVGERVRDMVRDNCLKGFVFHDVKVIKHEPLRDQAFSPAEMRGRFWALDAELQLGLSFGRTKRLEIMKLCDVCGWTEFGFPAAGQMSIKRDGWDGHDLFRVEGLDTICVSSRFRKLAKKAKLTLILQNSAYGYID